MTTPSIAILSGFAALGGLVGLVSGLSMDHRLTELRIELEPQRKLVSAAEADYVSEHGEFATSYEELQIEFQQLDPLRTKALRGGDVQWEGWIAYEYVFAGATTRLGDRAAGLTKHACEGAEDYCLVAIGDFDLGFLPTRELDVWRIDSAGLTRIESPNPLARGTIVALLTFMAAMTLLGIGDRVLRLQVLAPSP